MVISREISIGKCLNLIEIVGKPALEFLLEKKLLNEKRFSNAKELEKFLDHIRELSDSLILSYFSDFNFFSNEEDLFNFALTLQIDKRVFLAQNIDPENRVYTAYVSKENFLKIIETFREVPFFNKVWFESLDTVKSQLEGLQKSLDQGQVSQSKMKRTRHEIKQLQKQLDALEKNQTKTLPRVLHFYLNLVGIFSRQAKRLSFVLERFAPTIRETVLLQDPGTRLALTHLIQDSISVVFDENYTVHPLP